jgi:peptidyl-prolyl cis-trans isomerase D
MRNVTRGGIALVILGLISLAMVIFLIPGGNTILPSQDIAQVGSAKVTPAQLSREIENALRQARNEGQNVSQADAIEAGVHLRLLERLVARAAMDNYAAKIGVGASDTQIATYIRQMEAAQNPLTGQFDRAAYSQLLVQYGYARRGPDGQTVADDAEFEAGIRTELTANMLMESLVLGTRAPSSFGKMLLAYSSERRTVSLGEVPASAAGAIPQPNDAQVQAYYEENEAALTLPEYRSLVLVRATPADFAARVTVPEAQLREQFESHRASLTRPETRSYFRIAVANEAQAREAIARLGRREAPDAVARALNAQLTRGENQERSQIADSAVAAAVFSTAANAPAQAVQGELAPWTVVKVTAVTASAAPTFEQVRQQLHDEMALDHASELLQAAVATFEEARAAGTPVAEAARTAGLPSTTIDAIDAQGRNAQGQQFEGLPPDMIAVAFETAEGEASDFLPVGDADVVISVARVTPPAVRPLAEVRPQLVAQWLTRERARRLNEIGADVIAAINGGQTFAAVARQYRLNVIASSRDIGREEAGQLPARELAGLMFTAREGQAVSSLRADGGGLFVAHVERITRADPAAQPEQVEAGRMQLQQSLSESLGEAVQNEIIRIANPRRNQRLIDQLYANPNGQEDDTAP